jgi:hypothetical protein
LRGASFEGRLNVTDKTISAERRWALKILCDGGTVGHLHAALLDYGVTRKLLTEMVREGHAIALTRLVRVGRKKTRVSHVKITEAGRRALVGADAPKAAASQVTGGPATGSQPDGAELRARGRAKSGRQ